jgi:methanogenic corrinoid protein MtbC1
MTVSTISERSQLAQKILATKQSVAKSITDDFFLSHPEYVTRYGERGRAFCTADTCFHMEFLAGAIEAGSPESFGDYSQWTARMLGARGITAHKLEENLAQLEKHLCGVLLAGEQQIVLPFLTCGRKVCTAPEPLAAAESPGGHLDLTRRVFLAAILSGQRQPAINIIEEALRDGQSHVDIYVHVFAESLHQVGKLWEMNMISVAQEHMATAITQYAIAVAYQRMVPASAARGSMVVTGVSGELHQIGANLVADAMEAEGWKVRFLGTNVPPTSVLKTVEETAADVLCISTTIVANLPAVAELVQDVRKKLDGHAPRIVLGGAAFRFARKFAHELGATQAFSDLPEALASLCAA